MNIMYGSMPSIIPDIQYPVSEVTEEILEELWNQLTAYNFHYPTEPIENLNKIAVACHNQYPEMGEEIQKLVSHWIFLHL